jgi:hypothetical protein
MNKIKRKNIFLLLAGILILGAELRDVYADPNNFFILEGSPSFAYALGVLTRIMFAGFLVFEGLRK